MDHASYSPQPLMTTAQSVSVTEGVRSLGSREYIPCTLAPPLSSTADAGSAKSPKSASQPGLGNTIAFPKDLVHDGEAADNSANVEPSAKPLFVFFKTQEFIIVCAFSLTFIAFCIAAGLLSVFVDESTAYVSISNITTPPVHIVGSGGSFAVSLYTLWQTLYTQSFQTPSNRFKMEFLAVGTEPGMDYYMSGKATYGGFASNINLRYNHTILPANIEKFEDLKRISNVSQYLVPNSREHIGTMVFPSAAGGIGIAYNIPSMNGSLVLNATVLGGIFARTIYTWNDRAIMELNPTLVLPSRNISVVALSGSNGASQVFTEYLSKYSPEFRAIVGASTRPIWPMVVGAGGFYTASKSTESLTLISNIPFSIGYSPLNLLFDSNSESSFKMAAVVNAAGRPVYPTTESISAAMRSLPPRFDGHTTISITDSLIPNAYPLSMLNFFSTREHYFFNTSLSDSSALAAAAVKSQNQANIANAYQEACANVTTTVHYMQYSLTDPRVQEEMRNMGWVPLTPSLLEMSLGALRSVTCFGKKVVDMVEHRNDFRNFHNNDEGQILWAKSISLWSNVQKVGRVAPVSTGWTIAMTVSLYLASTLTAALNLWQYLNTYIKNRRSMSNLETMHNKGEKGTSPPTCEPLKQPPKKRKRKPKFRASLQNCLAVLTSFLNVIQFIFLALKNSKMGYYGTLTEKLYSIIALPYLKAYHVVILQVVVFFWLISLMYMMLIRPFGSEYFPESIARLETWHDFLAIFMPNFPFLLFTPALESLLESFVCRVSPRGEFVSVFDPVKTLCWKDSHWALVVLSYFLAVFFVVGVIRFSPIWKQLRQKFDLKDDPWYVVCEPFVKTICILSFFTFPAVGSLSILASLSAFMTIALLTFKPNTLLWFDHIRAVGYLLTFGITLTVLVIECIVPSDAYTTLKTLRMRLGDVVLVLTILGFLATFWMAYSQLPRTSLEEVKKRREEVLEMFKAISEGDAMRRFESSPSIESSSIYGQHSAHMVKGSALLHPQNNEHGQNLDQLSNSGNHLRSESFRNIVESKLSLGSTRMMAQINWRKLEAFVRKAAQNGMLEPKVAMKVIQEIQVEGIVVAYTFAKSRGNVKKFLDMLKLRLHYVDNETADQFTSRVMDTVNRAIADNALSNSVGAAAVVSAYLASIDEGLTNFLEAIEHIQPIFDSFKVATKPINQPQRRNIFNRMARNDRTFPPQATHFNRTYDQQQTSETSAPRMTSTPVPHFRESTNFSEPAFNRTAFQGHHDPALSAPKVQRRQEDVTADFIDRPDDYNERNFFDTRKLHFCLAAAYQLTIPAEVDALPPYEYTATQILACRKLITNEWNTCTQLPTFHATVGPAFGSSIHNAPFSQVARLTHAFVSSFEFNAFINRQFLPPAFLYNPSDFDHKGLTSNKKSEFPNPARYFEHNTIYWPSREWSFTQWFDTFDDESYALDTIFFTLQHGALHRHSRAAYRKWVHNIRRANPDMPFQKFCAMDNEWRRKVAAEPHRLRISDDCAERSSIVTCHLGNIRTEYYRGIPKPPTSAQPRQPATHQLVWSPASTYQQQPLAQRLGARVQPCQVTNQAQTKKLLQSYKDIPSATYKEQTKSVCMKYNPGQCSSPATCSRHHLCSICVVTSPQLLAKHKAIDNHGPSLVVKSGLQNASCATPHTSPNPVSRTTSRITRQTALTEVPPSSSTYRTQRQPTSTSNHTSPPATGSRRPPTRAWFSQRLWITSGARFGPKSLRQGGATHLAASGRTPTEIQS
ncbi:hypothetical protein HDV05_005166 [Chytridiales sp. JEL 0842]|nr:hypothetical protein HDV05_005166 [Chytridiales sp. JEL 0842]